MKTLHLAGGCFWGLEHFLKLLRGVTATTVGYANGHTPSPTYQDVCTDLTGYAETVRVIYDESLLPLPELLHYFFLAIDPTSVNRQGEDSGTQYRTGIYYSDPADLPAIRAAVADVARAHDAPIATEVEPLRNFFPAEDYHQDYLDNNPNGYCHLSPALFALARRTREEQQ